MSERYVSEFRVLLMSCPQLRRTKEALVSVALRLQVAIKLAKEDEQTLAQLAAEAEESKARELAATKRADEAVTLIRALTIEVNSLKRQLKAFENERTDSKTAQSSVMSLHQQAAMNEVADAEVDVMLTSAPVEPQPVYKDVSEVASKTATPFDKWKMSHFLFTPDTPAASVNHDKHVVDILMESATRELIDDIRSRRTTASLGKMKKLQKRISNEQDRTKMMNLTVHPANDYEGLLLPEAGLPPTAAPMVPHVTKPSSEKDFGEFFVSAGVEQKWGNRPTFEHANMGRVNLWAAGDQLHPVKKAPVAGSHGKSPVKLKSLASSSQAQLQKLSV